MDNYVHIHCHSSIIFTNSGGSYGSINVWYNPIGLEKILSLGDMENKHPIGYNHRVRLITTNTPEGREIFNMIRKGPRYLYFSENLKKAVILVRTVRDGYRDFTKQDVKKTKDDRKLMGTV